MTCEPRTACCLPSATFRRRFRTRQEKAARLECYAEALENELTAVRETIAELRPDEGGEDA